MQQFHSQSYRSYPASFGRYRVRSLLGEGAMGRVYLAEDPVLDRSVAIKVIAVEKQPDNRSRDEYLNRFNLEAKACAKLSHPSIVAIFDAGEENGLPWIAFEYVEGDQLERLIQPPVLLPIEKIISITLDITSALHHAHECSIVHRDIKPANILIDKRTHIAKLADFGVVKAPWVALTQDGSAVGSPGYMAPEQLEGSGTDARCDLFSLGIVLYQMLTGKHPFLKNSIPATIFATLHGNFTPVIELRSDAPEFLVNIVNKLLVADREKRIQNAALLLHQLRSGSRTEDFSSFEPPAFDNKALLGNNTRLKRISFLLQNAGKRSVKVLHSSSRIKLFREKISDFLHSLSRYFPSYTTIKNRLNSSERLLFTTTASLLLLLSAAFLLLPRISPRFSRERTILNELSSKGYPVKTSHLIDTCISLADAGQFEEAKMIARKLSQLRHNSAQALLLLGIIALLEENDIEVIRLFTASSEILQWKKHLKNHEQKLLDACQYRLSEDEADSTLISSLAENILFNCKDSVITWTSNTAYWLRWNSIRIAGRLNLTVDSVQAYILDLQYAGSVRTRKRAATLLGELGDERAIEPLRIAAGKGLRDPAVSYTARLVLDNYFSKNNNE